MTCSVKNFRGFYQTGYRPSNDFHVCDLSLPTFANFTPVIHLSTGSLKFAPEPLEQLREGWRWVFVRNIGVGGCHANLNEIGFRELWALRGRRGWIILQESVDVGTRTIWVHRLVLSVRDRHILGIVRKGNLCPDFLSEALDCLLEYSVFGIFEMEVFNLLSKYNLNRVLDREPWLLTHFCMEKVLELKPPPEVWQFSFICAPELKFEMKAP